MRMIFIFIDGLGIGTEDKSKNPISAANTPGIYNILRNYRVIPTDTTMDVPGLPQSATGQTAIFTGVNAAKALGRHLNGQPTITLKKILHKNNLFKELQRRGLKVTNSNVYRREYLEKMFDLKDRRHRPSVTSVMTLTSGLKLRTVEDYKQGKGVYHDIRGKVLVDSGYDVELISPQEAAQRLYSVSRDYDFTLFEHFMTDIVGHKTDMDMAVEELRILDEFLKKLMELLDPDEDVVFITSDHGNIEDISVKTHTFNKVPTIIFGNIPLKGCRDIKTLMDIMPCILDIFDTREKLNGQ